MKIKPAGLYVRVSTEDQRTELREHPLNEYVERRGWKVHKTYRDTMSGATASRLGLDELLKDSRRRAIDVVVVWKFDRSARSLKTLMSGLELCRALVIDFVSNHDSYSDC
jgi:DNA invertase Pin-like site-specific DNA recombinase